MMKCHNCDRRISRETFGHYECPECHLISASRLSHLEICPAPVFTIFQVPVCTKDMRELSDKASRESDGNPLGAPSFVTLFSFPAPRPVWTVSPLPCSKRGDVAEMERAVQEAEDRTSNDSLVPLHVSQQRIGASYLSALSFCLSVPSIPDPYDVARKSAHRFQMTYGKKVSNVKAERVALGTMLLPRGTVSLQKIGEAWHVKPGEIMRYEQQVKQAMWDFAESTGSNAASGELDKETEPDIEALCSKLTVDSLTTKLCADMFENSQKIGDLDNSFDEVCKIVSILLGSRLQGRSSPSLGDVVTLMQMGVKNEDMVHVLSVFQSFRTVAQPSWYEPIVNWDTAVRELYSDCDAYFEKLSGRPEHDRPSVPNNEEAPFGVLAASSPSTPLITTSLGIPEDTDLSAVGSYNLSQLFEDGN